ncbi:MAG: c-type cytochrome [Pirellulaceae bacterium]|nr:c-type cytochrome [Pirellulaceae bacterium]
MRSFFLVNVALVIALIISPLICSAQIKRATDAPMPLSPTESQKQIRVPAGFRIELVASEPLIQEPSCIAFDEYGRLFVTELHGYNVEGELDVTELNKTGELDREVRRLRWEFIGGEIADRAKELQYGKLKVLSDTDGDGRMDSAQLWADDLPPAYGVIPAYGGVVVVAAPEILFFADRDGDGRPEIRKTLYTGFKKREMERGINNPRRGVDNWIYIGAGGHGGTIQRPQAITDAAQTKTLPAVDLSNSDFRINLATQEIEPVTGRVGTFGLAINDVGDRFPCSGGQPAVYALPLDYTALTRNPWVPTPSMNHSAADYGNGFRISQPHPWRVRRRKDPAWIKFYGDRETNSNYFTGGCGGEIYNAALFPRDFQGDFFYCEPSLNIVHRSELTRDGAGYQARRAANETESEFLASTDQWFRPMNLRTGPDGAIYIVDMYREIIEDYSAIPRFLQQQYGLDRGRDRGRIWRLLPLDAPPAISHALLSLDGPDPQHLPRSQLVALLEHPNRWQRNTAQRLVLERDGVFDFDVVATLKQLIRSSPSPLAKIHASHLLASLDSLSDLDLLVLLSAKDHRVRRHAAKLSGNRRLSSDALARLHGLVFDPDPAVRLQVAQALAGKPGADDALMKLANQHGDDRWMNAAILASVKQGGPMLSDLLNAKEMNAGERSLVVPLAASLVGGNDTIRLTEVINRLPTVDPELQLDCLRGIATTLNRWGDDLLDDGQSERRDALVSLIQTDHAEVRQLAINVAVRLLPKDALRETFTQALKTTLHVGNEEDRIAAIKLLGNAPFDLLRQCEALLDSRQSLQLQQAAIDAIGVSASPEVGVVLLDRWQEYTPEIKKHALQTILARENRYPALAEAIIDGRIRVTELNASQQNLLQRLPADQARHVHAVLSAEEKTVDTDVAGRIKHYSDVLGKGNRSFEQGRRVFEKTCLNCHKLRDEGYAVGPSLGSVLNKPNEAILVDILDPSSKIDSEYISYTVITDQGKSFTGVLGSESPTSVILKLDKGKTATILRKEIDVMRASQVSLMPSNLHEQITADQMADLLDYVRKAFGDVKQAP